MAEKTFILEIVSPERITFKKSVASVTVPGSEGSIGILADHAPIMAELVIGEIRIRDVDGNVTRLATSGGFMEVSQNTVRILADTAERKEDIDLARAEEAKRRAEERLLSQRIDIDRARAEAALKRAIIRLRVARGE
ncbi:MAG TPA: F0F1 ATP synthase subunit epsilon [Armatimonadota bacterium]|jgi:F-type H+-transporting ATPase subunit epsilon